MSSSTEQEGEISTPNVLKLSSDLRPLMFWMSNATELLNFFQVKVEAMEKEWEFEGENDLKAIWENCQLNLNWTCRKVNILNKISEDWQCCTYTSLCHLNHHSVKAQGDPLLTADRDTCSEALAQLDDVIMHTFQQCVYHLTKVEYKKQDYVLFSKIFFFLCIWHSEHS